MSPRTALPLYLEYALLGLIYQKPQYGYDILQKWDKNLGVIWKVKPGWLYAALNKLEKHGLLVSQLESGENAPDRKVFALTAEGEAAFLRWMRTPVLSPREFRQEWFAKLFFFSELPRDARRELYEGQTRAAESWLRQQSSHNYSGSAFEARVRDFRTKQIQSILDYLNETKQSILEG
ncbi:MAG: PadR family transcriptional regulator [Chloroflexi bacterium]|nr:PadR family transcriptional regulator [Chloroflexota bacterium]